MCMLSCARQCRSAVPSYQIEGRPQPTKQSDILRQAKRSVLTQSQRKLKVQVRICGILRIKNTCCVTQKADVKVNMSAVDILVV